MDERMKKRVGRLVIAAMAAWIVATPGAGTAGAEDGARELVKGVLDEAGKHTITSRMTLSSDGESREMEMLRKRIDGLDKVTIKVTAPFHYKGVRYLFLEEEAGRREHYSFLPALRRTTRIAEDAKNQPFLGSEFYVADMIPPDLDAYTYRFVGEETIGERACRLVERVSKQGGSLYGKSIIAIDPADRLAIRTEFFDSNGKAIKVWTVDKLEKVEEVWTALEQTMRPADGGQAWMLRIEEIDYGAEIGDEEFAPRGIEG